ncbi:MAG: hypothetical protein HKP13_01610, partial [Gammaproteobacteria bacterium]|nr:hypothetical protein [Gammaproteobacteria bacterium]
MNHSNGHEQQTDLIGRTLKAKVSKVHNDSCFLELLDEETGKPLALGRLNQQDSLAWERAELLEDIPKYAVGETIEQVYVSSKRYEQGQL